MSKQKRTGLVLSVPRLWWMSLPFRPYFRGGMSAFSPGAGGLLRFEIRRLGYALFERERLKYLLERILRR